MVAMASHELHLLGVGQSLEQRGHLVIRALVQRREDLAATVAQAQQTLPAVVFGPLAIDQTLASEVVQDAAEVAGVEVELAGELGGRDVDVLRQLVEHAHLRQRKRAAQIALFEQPDVPRVQTIEAAHVENALRRDGVDHCAIALSGVCCQCQPVS